MSSDQSEKLDDDIAIKLDDVSKCYQIYDRPHHRFLQGVYRGRKQFYKEFWALRDISFEVKKGETVGIIGRNGSGKSTLLQIICGTLTPSAGKVQTNGRVAALLELGSGFNPEFTGCENVYMNAVLLGLSKVEVDARFDDIAAFADIGEFIEQPVKSYSSGMVMRLAFAVAINVDPEILVVDEALSVGDELFQRKCFSKIETMKKRGTTILFVSHSGNTIVELCDRALLLDFGELLAVGKPKQIVGYYQKLIYAAEDRYLNIREQIRKAGTDIIDSNSSLVNKSCNDYPNTTNPSALQESYDPNLKPSSTICYESHGAHIQTPVILTMAGKQVNNLIRGKTYRYKYTVHFTKNANNVICGMLIKTTSGVELGGATSDKHVSKGLLFINKDTLMHVEYQFTCLLNHGLYFINAGVSANVRGEFKYLDRILDAACFRVVHENTGYSTGIVDFSCFPTICITETQQ